MLHTFGYAGAVVVSTNNQALAAPSDSSMTRTANGNQYLSPADWLVVMGWAMNDLITRARINYPSYRDVGLPEISPVLATSTMTPSFGVSRWGQFGPRIRKTEELGMDISCGVSITLVGFGGLSVMDRFDAVPGGRKFTVRGTAPVTLVANQYALGTLTLDQTLPFGRYGVIGLTIACTNGFLGRLVFPSTPQYRPGCPVTNTAFVIEFEQSVRQGEMGLLGIFDQTAPPQVEILGITAGAQTAAIILDLVELGR